MNENTPLTEIETALAANLYRALVAATEKEIALRTEDELADMDFCGQAEYVKDGSGRREFGQDTLDRADAAARYDIANEGPSAIIDAPAVDSALDLIIRHITGTLSDARIRNALSQPFGPAIQQEAA